MGSKGAISIAVRLKEFGKAAFEGGEKVFFEFFVM